MKISERKIVALDLETTGTDPTRSEILQIGAVALNEELFEIEAFERKIRIEGDFASPEARKANSFEPGAWEKDALPARQVAREFSEFLKRHATIRKEGKRGKPYYVARLMGHNAASFDGPFLRAWYERLGEFLPACYSVLCTLKRAEWYFLENPHLKRPRDYKLGTLCAYFGVELGDEAHDALADARATASLYRSLFGVPVLNHLNTTARVKFYQSGSSPWNCYVTHNGERPPPGEYREVSPDAVGAVSRLLKRAEELEPRGLNLKTLIEKSESFRAARVYTEPR